MSEDTIVVRIRENENAYTKKVTVTTSDTLGEAADAFAAARKLPTDRHYTLKLAGKSDAEAFRRLTTFVDSGLDETDRLELVRTMLENTSPPASETPAAPEPKSPKKKTPVRKKTTRKKSAAKKTARRKSSRKKTTGRKKTTVGRGRRSRTSAADRPTDERVTLAVDMASGAGTVSESVSTGTIWVTPQPSQVARPRAVDSARVIQVIETEALRGLGTEGDRCRIVTQYWDVDGRFLAERDPETRLTSFDGDTDKAVS